MLHLLLVTSVEQFKISSQNFAGRLKWPFSMSPSLELQVCHIQNTRWQLPPFCGKMYLRKG